ncbi:MAG: hypothetical protein ABDH32_02915 [Candidatus Caldarchaeales archaeon]
MRSEPSTKTGLTFLLIGVTVTLSGIVLERVQLDMLRLQEQYLALSTTLYVDIGPGLTAAGLAWIVSSINPIRKSYLIPISIGIVLPTLVLSLGSIILEIGYLGAIIWHLTLFTIPPAFIASSVVAGVIVERHRRRDKVPDIKVRFEKHLLYLIAIALFLIFSREPLALLRLVILALTTWILWHFISPRLACYLIARKMRRGMRRYELVSHKRNIEELTLINVFSKSYYPLAFGLGLSLTLFNIVEIFPIPEGLVPSEPMSKVVQLVMFSILAIVVGSAYVGPVVWLYRDSGIRVKDNVSMVVEEPKIHSFANNLVEVYGFIQAPISFTIAATGGDYLYAITLLALLIVTILTVSLSVVILYVRFSSESNLRYLINRLVKEGYIQPSTGVH